LYPGAERGKVEFGRWPMPRRFSLFLLWILFNTLLASAQPLPAADLLRVDETVPFPKDGTGILKIQAGPITLEEILIRNMPDAEDIAKAKLDPDDNCHPKLQVGMSNSGATKMEVELRVQLLDGDGNVYMDCKRSDTVDPGAVNDHTNLCWLSSMKTVNFPKLAKVHIVATFKPR
jgi:hypothetical protein